MVTQDENLRTELWQLAEDAAADGLTGIAAKLIEAIDRIEKLEKALRGLMAGDWDDERPD